MVHVLRSIGPVWRSMLGHDKFTLYTSGVEEDCEETSRNAKRKAFFRSSPAAGPIAE